MTKVREIIYLNTSHFLIFFSSIRLAGRLGETGRASGGGICRVILFLCSGMYRESTISRMASCYFVFVLCKYRELMTMPHALLDRLSFCWSDILLPVDNFR
jgi:hypothetical protein